MPTITHCERVSEDLLNIRVHIGGDRADPQTRLNGLQGGIRLAMKAEESEEPVTHVVVDPPAVRFDGGTRPREEPIEYVDHVVRREMLGHLRETRYIDEHDHGLHLATDRPDVMPFAELRRHLDIDRVEHEPPQADGTMHFRLAGQPDVVREVELVGHLLLGGGSITQHVGTVHDADATRRTASTTAAEMRDSDPRLRHRSEQVLVPFERNRHLFRPHEDLRHVRQPRDRTHHR